MSNCRKLGLVIASLVVRQWTESIKFLNNNSIGLGGFTGQIRFIVLSLGCARTSPRRSRLNHLLISIVMELPMQRIAGRPAFHIQPAATRALASGR